MEIRQLRFFLLCAEKGSLTRAAEALYTSQPHVSQVIASLEEELGVKLFRRTGGGIRLTEEGERVRLYAANVLKNAELLREACAPPPCGELRIAANPSSRLAFLTEEFARAAGAAGPELFYTECAIEPMMDLLQGRRYDLGFLFLPSNRLPAFRQMAERRQLEYTPLLFSDLVVHGGRKSPFYGRERLAPEELDGCRCIQLEDDFFSVEELLSEHEAFAARRCAIKKVIHTNSDHLMLHTLRNTELCNIGSYWSREDHEDPDLSRTVIDGFQGQVSFGYLQNRSLALPEAGEAFLRLVRERLAK